MKTRYRLIERRERLNPFYCVDTVTGRRTALGAVDRDAAEQLVLAKNQALRQPVLNLQIAKAYLAGSDSGVATRTWTMALDALMATKAGTTQLRWRTAAKDKALVPLLTKVIIESTADDLLSALRTGTVSTNVHLRKLHNFCLAMTWLPWPLIPKPQWPAVRYGEKRAITADEHALVMAREGNPERRNFYQLCWSLGGSQSDIAELTADCVDWEGRTLSYNRKKTGSQATLHFGPAVAAVLESLPRRGPLFPYLATVRSCDRATEFKQRCVGLGIHGVTLHSYRYAWAERARKAGYPERFAQEALGHNSKAIHRAYAKRAQVSLPPLEQYEARSREGLVVQFPLSSGIPLSAPPVVVDPARGA